MGLIWSVLIETHELRPRLYLQNLVQIERLFVLMLVITVTITIDSEIGYVADFIPEQISSNTGVFVFILIAVIFMVTQYLILDYVKHLNKETRRRVPHLSNLHSGVSTFTCIV